MKSHAILFSFLFAISAILFTTAKAQVDVNDSLALVDLYNNTNGPTWYNQTNWLTKEPVSTWYGITVTGTRVTGIFIRYNNLSGPIPASIGNLTNLGSLDLYNNPLTGSIPACIGNLVNLKELWLISNQLSGSIPASIGNCVNLIKLDLSVNQLSGSIPYSIGKLVHLKYLNLAFNQFNGSIPSSIGNCVSLKWLHLDNNQLSGAIPSSIGNCIKLRHLYLHDNQLSGSIPASIGKLVNINFLLLYSNQLSGSIPASIGKLVNLSYLYLHNNQLSGSIPLQKFKLLTVADLSHNQLALPGNPDPTELLNPLLDINVSYNHSTFNGLEYLAKSCPKAMYAPQDTILSIHYNGSKLAVSAGGTLSKNIYHWYKVGSTDSTIVEGNSTFAPLKSGKYYVRVTNAIATQLTLYSDTIEYNRFVTAQNGIENQLKPLLHRLLVYPNPAKDIIQVQVASNATVILTNAAGRALLTTTINNRGEINVSMLANGIYYLQNKTTGEMQKIVIMH